MAEYKLSNDTQVALLMCGHFGGKRTQELTPLTTREYNNLVAWLRGKNLSVSDLLTANGRGALEESRLMKLTPRRLLGLLDRGVALAMAVEKWTAAGLRIAGYTDATYPDVLRKRLRYKAPPILFVVGDNAALRGDALGIVGSRDADEGSLAFSRHLAAKCARDGVTVVSGAAKGVDLESMLAAVGEGGRAVGVLPEGVIRPAVSRRFRKAIEQGQVTLISEFYPDARWTIGNAMARNKCVYALSSATVVVCSGTEGGTWTGARENLSKRWVPLFVREDPSAAEGNRALIRRGGFPVTDGILANTKPILVTLEGVEASEQRRMPQVALVREVELTGTELTNAPEMTAAPTDTGETLFDAVWPILKPSLVTPRSPKEIAELHHGLQVGQVRSWLENAVSLGKAMKLTRPVRYTLPESDLFDSP